jgi:small redox-active disulfide protein 2
MKIQVLGTGCADCITLYENTKKALDESGKQGEVLKVVEINAMLKYGVTTLPALVIDGQLKCSGKMLSVAEIKGML